MPSLHACLVTAGVHPDAGYSFTGTYLVLPATHRTCLGGRSWRHLTGAQLDCLPCATENAVNESFQQSAPVALSTSRDGGMPAASTTVQSDAAKQDLGRAKDANMGNLRPMAFGLLPPADAPLSLPPLGPNVPTLSSSSTSFSHVLSTPP